MSEVLFPSKREALQSALVHARADGASVFICREVTPECAKDREARGCEHCLEVAPGDLRTADELLVAAMVV